MASVFEELPQPVRLELTPEQKYQRRHQFAVSINWFALGYTIIHKLILPYFINYFAVSRSFHYLDWWWLFHLGLGLLLLRKDWDDVFLKSAIYFGFGGVVTQLAASFREYNWHIVSLWITSAATAGVLVYLLSFVKSKIIGPMRLIGPIGLILGFFFQYALFGFTLTVEKQAIEKKSAEKPLHYFPHLISATQCGARAFTLKVESGAWAMSPAVTPTTVHELGVGSCGFDRALGLLPSHEGITIKNNEDHYLNVKVYSLESSHWKAISNMPLRVSATQEIPAALLSDKEIVMITSDSDANKGITILMRDPSAWNQLLKASPQAHMILVDRFQVEVR